MINALKIASLASNEDYSILLQNLFIYFRSRKHELKYNNLNHSLYNPYKFLRSYLYKKRSPPPPKISASRNNNRIRVPPSLLVHCCV